MRLARAALIGLSVLLAAALIAAWLVPPQLDWSRYRATIAQLAGNRLGLPVTIEGPVSLTLLPEPVLTAEKVSVGSPAADGVLIRVQALRLRVAPLPLLRGRVDARELVLHRPDLHIPWPTRPNMLSARPPAWLTAFAARIEDGRLSVGQFAVTGINGTLSSLDTGALHARVSADIAGQRWHVDSRLTSTAADGSSGLSVRLRGEGRAAGTTASFSGQFSPGGQLAGSVRAAGPDLSLLLPTPALRFSAEGRLTVADGLAEADELTVKLDGAPASGAVALRMLPRPRVDVALSATRLNLDPWTPLLLRQPPARQHMPVGLDFSASAATLAGATLTHLQASFELVPGVVKVQDVAATLPGNAQLQLSGVISRGDGSPSFQGAGRLHAPVLRTTLKWLLPHAGPQIAVLPAGVAQRADLSGAVNLRPGRVVLTKLQGHVRRRCGRREPGLEGGQAACDRRRPAVRPAGYDSLAAPGDGAAFSATGRAAPAQYRPAADRAACRAGNRAHPRVGPECRNPWRRTDPAGIEGNREGRAVRGQRCARAERAGQRRKRVADHQRRRAAGPVSAGCLACNSGAVERPGPPGDHGSRSAPGGCRFAPPGAGRPASGDAADRQSGNGQRHGGRHPPEPQCAAADL